MRAVLEVPAGALADRWSRRGCLVCGGLAIGAGVALMVSLPSLPTAIAGETLLAIGAALRSGVDSALLYDGLTSLGAAERLSTGSAPIPATKRGNPDPRPGRARPAIAPSISN